MIQERFGLSAKKLRMWAVGLALLAGIVAVLLAVLKGLDVSPQMILDYRPQKTLWIAGVFLLLYALKCVTIFFPVMALWIAAGHLLPAWMAIGVNLAGTLICLTLPYWLGYWAGIRAIDRLTSRHPRFQEVLAHQQENSRFLCFFLRIAGGLSGDVVTLYLGATHTPFLQNLVGGALGIFPKMVLATLIGSNIRDTGSPVFWISLSLSLLLTVGSALGYYIHRKRGAARK